MDYGHGLGLYGEPYGYAMHMQLRRLNATLTLTQADILISMRLRKELCRTAKSRTLTLC